MKHWINICVLIHISTNNVLPQLISGCVPFDRCTERVLNIFTFEDTLLRCRELLRNIPCAQNALRDCPSLRSQDVDLQHELVSDLYNSSNCAELLKEITMVTDTSTVSRAMATKQRYPWMFGSVSQRLRYTTKGAYSSSTSTSTSTSASTSTPASKFVSASTSISAFTSISASTSISAPTSTSTSASTSTSTTSPASLPHGGAARVSTVAAAAAAAATGHPVSTDIPIPPQTTETNTTSAAITDLATTATFTGSESVTTDRQKTTILPLKSFPPINTNTNGPKKTRPQFPYVTNSPLTLTTRALIQSGRPTSSGLTKQTTHGSGTFSKETTSSSTSGHGVFVTILTKSGNDAVAATNGAATAFGGRMRAVEVVLRVVVLVLTCMTSRQ